MKRKLGLILAGLLALGLQGQQSKLAETPGSEEKTIAAKSAGDFYIYSARENLESALLRSSEAWKWRQDSIKRADSLIDNNITTNLTEYSTIAGLRASAALQEKSAGNLTSEVQKLIGEAAKVYFDHNVKSRAEPPIIDEYLMPYNCFLRANQDITTAIQYYQLAKNNLGEASLRESLASDAKKMADKYKQDAKNK